MPACEDKDYLSNVEIQFKDKGSLMGGRSRNQRYFAKAGFAAMLSSSALLALKSGGLSVEVGSEAF